jgi:hypothetical protein
MIAPYVYSGNGCGYTSIFHSGNNDNSSANRDKDILVIRDNVWRKYKLQDTNVICIRVRILVYTRGINGSVIGEWGTRYSIT